MDFIKRLKDDSKKLIGFLLALALLVMIIFIIITGFVFWFWISLVIWVVFFILFILKLLKVSLGCWMGIFFIILILSIIFMISGSHKKTTGSGSSSTTATKLSADECKPFYDKYNNKVLKISGTDIVGSIGIKINPDDCKLSGRYIFALTAALPANPIPEIAVSSYYNYVNNLHKSTETVRGHYGVGVLSQATQNTMTLPDPFSTSQQVSTFYRNQTDYAVHQGTSFYWSYESMGYFSQERYQAMLDNNVFEIVNGLPYMDKETSASGGFSYSIDQEKAEVDGTIVKTFNMTISE